VKFFLSISMAAFACVCGCASVIGLDELQRTGCVDGCDAGAPDATPDAPPLAPCPGTAGPTAIAIGAHDGKPVCIDATEVTNADYAAFLAAVPASAAAKPDGCTSKKSFVPAAGWPAMVPNEPVVQVDWCDAFAFCAWAGKSLCGRNGGTAIDTGADDSLKGTWYQACSGPGSTAYPYGSTYQAATCNDQSAGGVIAPVASRSACVGGFAHLFDMSGNAAEWENACADVHAADTDCSVRGGDYTSSPSTSTHLTCLGRMSLARTSASAVVGFRCCSP
jgi:formylglycine-generating enzyme required for sulfatase activity